MRTFCYHPTKSAASPFAFTRLAAIVTALFVAASAHAATPADLILTGGAVYTLDPARPWASAVVVAGGQIAYVGDDAHALAYRGPDSRVIALSGRMVLPGFHDAHIHPMTGAMRLLRCQLGDLKTSEQIYAAVRDCAAADASHTWLLGDGWSEQAFGSNGPSLAKLDALVPDRPAFLRNGDGFTAWVNSRTLALAGIDARGPAIKGVVRDPVTGKPTGILKDDACEFVRRLVPPPTQTEYIEALRRSTAMANRFGITSLFDADANETVVDAYRAADMSGKLTVRVMAAQQINPERGPEQVDEMIARRARVDGTLFHADAAKLFLDGEIEMHTAALLAPYADAPDSRGDLLIQPAALNALVRRLDQAGFLIHMHAMGDRAVRAGLDALEGAVRANGPRERRDQIAHVGVADPADIPRFARLGIAANVSPMWFQADDPAAAGTDAALGPTRARWIMPVASIAAAGAAITAGSDWPSTSMNPLDGIEAAVTRQPLGGGKPARQPQERMSLAAILAAYTRTAAWAAREDGIDGTITAGKAADLIVLDRNLFRVPVASIHEARVLLTLLGGRPVWRDPSFDRSFDKLRMRGNK
jgi:predicted amidohydrolase YtcJ